MSHSPQDQNLLYFLTRELAPSSSDPHATLIGAAYLRDLFATIEDSGEPSYRFRFLYDPTIVLRIPQSLIDKYFTQ
jgi:hypothetical protein